MAYTVADGSRSLSCITFVQRYVVALFLFLLLPTLAWAMPPDVLVKGVEGELHQNIIANLKIAQQKQEANLSAGQMRRLHKQAPEQIAKALTPFGYYAAKVTNNNGKGVLEKNGSRWYALYEVETGPAVLVESLSIEVTGPGKAHEALKNLAAKFPLQRGDRLNDGRYEAGKKRILNLALSNGYIRARFTESRVEVKAKDHKAAIRLCLDSGPLHVFGATSSSQYILKPELLQHYVSYKPGDVYSLEALNRLQSDLYSTGYFSQVTVEPKLLPPEEEQHEVPVELHLQPAPKNRYSLGGGYGTDTGVRGNIGWKNRMINRQGHRPSFNVQLAEKGSRAVGGYEIPVPILDLRYDTIGFDTLYSEESWDDTEISQYTFGSTIKHNGPKYQFGAGVEYLHEAYTVGGRQDDSTWLLMPNAFLTMILAENRVNTDHGIRVSGSIRGAQAPYFASTSFFQFRVGGKAILSVAEKWRVIGRASFGATTMESIDKLPPSLRFYAGGDQSVRGYGYKSLGPTDNSGRVVGGQYLTEGSVELERKLFGIWSAAVFYDLGNAYDTIDANLQQGVGVGVRMTLPFGQIRLDLADAISEEGFSLRIHLTLGADL
ncbi:MAG: autotransporter secretion outer membrane protein TamA [Candidatus Electronema aureum]|uniref:Translocation and assembly module subunit TamA n=1 Tax=Candidatus Electronema aureum TaxID=2005002 RepID=A0A521G5C6_9BACT|nr:MAG: autotransporter secretion outer membrane protein TamA [Candidatus Electronema aureum]